MFNFFINIGPRLRFPLTDQDDYKGTISFTALKTDYESLGRVAARQINNATAISAGGSGRGLVVERPGERTAATSVSRSSTSSNALNDLFGFFGNNFRSFNSKSGGTTAVGKVQLYLPTSISFQDTIDYSTTDLGAIGAAAAQGLTSGKPLSSVAADAISGISTDFESFIDAFTGGIKSETATVAVLRTIGKVSDTVRGAVEVSTGLTLNPNRRSTLKGVALRTFNFTFNLIPESRDEAERIKEIIFFFREQMYPEDVSAGGVAVGYRFPNKFRIEMAYDGKPVATKILPCFLEGFNTNYNPNSMSFHEDGNFPEINISLTFREERTLRKADIKGGF